MVQKKLEIHPFSFHKLRHFFVSQALASKDVSIADVQKYGGWATDSVMKTVYNHSTKSAEQVSNAIKIF
jgi:integrase